MERLEKVIFSEQSTEEIDEDMSAISFNPEILEDEGLEFVLNMQKDLDIELTKCLAQSQYPTLGIFLFRFPPFFHPLPVISPNDCN